MYSTEDYFEEKLNMLTKYLPHLMQLVIS